MIERRIRAHAHELPRANFDDGHARIVMKVRDDVIRHSNPTPILILRVFAHSPAYSDDAAAASHHTERYDLFLVPRSRRWIRPIRQEVSM
ncbi:Uncharacterised protein [Mycobacterium tuberculosis]|nr:Uncharacterised protein [Mycobacterium tuberculosis]